ncbi:hypothetical protein BC830DRAFT_1087021, partial [Chytriomyces sp. MP71]
MANLQAAVDLAESTLFQVAAAGGIATALVNEHQLPGRERLWIAIGYVEGWQDYFVSQPVDSRLDARLEDASRNEARRCAMTGVCACWFGKAKLGVDWRCSRQPAHLTLDQALEALIASLQHLPANQDPTVPTVPAVPVT